MGSNSLCWNPRNKLYYSNRPKEAKLSWRWSMELSTVHGAFRKLFFTMCNSKSFGARDTDSRTVTIARKYRINSNCIFRFLLTSVPIHRIVYRKIHSKKLFYNSENAWYIAVKKETCDLKHCHQ